MGWTRPQQPHTPETELRAQAPPTGSWAPGASWALSRQSPLDLHTWPRRRCAHASRLETERRGRISAVTGDEGPAYSLRCCCAHSPSAHSAREGHSWGAEGLGQGQAVLPLQEEHSRVARRGR